jgi:N-methylhydantoinase B
MAPGDIYLTNDPWIASGHLNDFLLMMPVFHRGAVIGFTACTSHLIDLGGLGMGPEGSDIYDEGLLIPPCKLVDRGAVNTLLMEIVKANSREPIANEGDIYALMACCEAGAARLQAMMTEFGLSDLDTLADYIIETSRKGTLDAIADLPNGTWSSTLRVDGYDRPLDLKAALTIAEDSITVDFTGSPPLCGQGDQRAAELRHRLHCLRAALPDRAGHPEQRGVIGPVHRHRAARVHPERAGPRPRRHAPRHRPDDARPRLWLPVAGPAGPRAGGGRVLHVRPAAEERAGGP